MNGNGFPNTADGRGPNWAETKEHNGVKNPDQNKNQNLLRATLRVPLWDTASMRQFPKHFYTPGAYEAQRSEMDSRLYRMVRKITIFGHSVPDPVQNIDDVGLPDFVVREIRRQGFGEPTPIQAQGWSIALSGRDIIGIAPTGSGKTLAYMLPTVVHVSHQESLSRFEGPIALVLAPTSNRAQQIQSVAEDLGSDPSTQIRSACVCEGRPRESQARDLERGVEIVIATPGRLIDFLESGWISLRRCTFLVVDDVDIILKMGYLSWTQNIIQQVRPDRQMLMWTSTWPKEVQNFAGSLLNDYIEVNIGYIDFPMKHNIRQTIDICQEHEKEEKLSRLLHELAGGKAIVFAATTEKVADITKLIRREGWQAISILGDESQSERDYLLAEFRIGKSNILVATDDASQGLDMEDVNYVFNYDYPNSAEYYVRRIERIGRVVTYPVEWNDLDSYIKYFFVNRNEEEKRKKEDVHVIHLSKYEEMKTFKEITQNELLPTLNVDNCCEMAVAAKKYYAGTIKKAATDVIVSNNRQLLNTIGHKRFYEDKRNVDLLLDVYRGVIAKQQNNT